MQALTAIQVLAGAAQKALLSSHDHDQVRAAAQIVAVRLTDAERVLATGTQWYVDRIAQLEAQLQRAALTPEVEPPRSKDAPAAAPLRAVASSDSEPGEGDAG